MAPLAQLPRWSYGSLLGLSCKPSNVDCQVLNIRISEFPARRLPQATVARDGNSFGTAASLIFFLHPMVALSTFEIGTEVHVVDSVACTCVPKSSNRSRRQPTFFIATWKIFFTYDRQSPPTNFSSRWNARRGCSVYQAPDQVGSSGGRVHHGERPQRTGRDALT